ncbi:MAG: RecX family transcriptional regulator [Bacteroidales bacterium]|nr:RecX family transcriptional regulator [Bacteroidales bacterium]
MDEAAKKLLGRLQNLCAKQECCSADMLQKALKALDFDRAAAQEVVDALVKDKYVDDARYAAAFAREKASITGWGPIKIRYALAGKGIKGETVDNALEEIDPGRADAKLRKLLENKWKNLREDPQGKLKLIKFALSRGYEYESIKAEIEEICR